MCFYDHWLDFLLKMFKEMPQACGSNRKLGRFLHIQSCSTEFFKTNVMGPFVPLDIMKSKSNPDFLKKDRSCVSRQLRNIRSKVSLGCSPRVCGPMGR